MKQSYIAMIILLMVLCTNATYSKVLLTKTHFTKSDIIELNTLPNIVSISAFGSVVFDERGYLTELILGDVMPASAAMRGMDISEVNDEDNGSERRFAEYYSFTIRSLTPDRQYYFVRQSLAGDEVIDEEQGSFETLPDTETGLNNGNTTTDLTPTPASKQLREGQVIIVAPDGSTYSPDGKILKDQRPLR